MHAGRGMFLSPQMRWTAFFSYGCFSATCGGIVLNVPVMGTPIGPTGIH
jgi:hypothetical protein